MGQNQNPPIFPVQGYMNVDQVAEYLGYSVGTIYNKVARGEIPHHKFSAKSVRFKKHEIDGWIAEQEKRVSAGTDRAPAIPADVLEIFRQNPVEAPLFLRKKFGK
jgi:excisionase family DNA binding protein